MSVFSLSPSCKHAWEFLQLKYDYEQISSLCLLSLFAEPLFSVCFDEIESFCGGDVKFNEKCSSEHDFLLFLSILITPQINVSFCSFERVRNYAIATGSWEIVVN